VATPGIVRTHPVAAYFGLTFAISWGGVLLVIGGWPHATAVKAQDHPLFPLAVLATLAGPSVAGLLLTAVLEGRTGLRNLASRFQPRRVTARWYALLLAAPLAAIASTGLIAAVVADARLGLAGAGDPGAIIGLAMLVGALAGLCEEIGWTGFVVPRLLDRHGVVATPA
jgi:hypothetical protein